MSIRSVVGPVLTMLDEAGSSTTGDWAKELLTMEGDTGDLDREVQRAYLKTVLALCRFEFHSIDEAERLLKEASLAVERLHPSLSMLLAWYLAHIHYMRALDAIGRGADMEGMALTIATEFATVAKVAEEVRNDPLRAGLAYSIAAEYARRGGKRHIAHELAGRSTTQLTRVRDTDDPRVEQRMLINRAIMTGERFDPSDVLELLHRPGELQSTLPGE